MWSALFPTEASIRKSAGTTVASADGPLFGDVLELLKSRILLAAAVTETMEVGIPCPVSQAIYEAVGAASLIKRLAEVGSLSILSLAGSTTTRGLLCALVAPLGWFHANEASFGASLA